METLDKNFTSGELYISNQSKHFLIYSSKWANFLSIMGFIGLGLLVILAFFFIGMSSSFMGAQMAIMGMVYLVMAVLYFFPTYYLFKFASKTKHALNNKDQMDLEIGFENLKSMFKFMGIFTIVIISLYICLFAFTALMAAMN